MGHVIGIDVGGTFTDAVLIAGDGRMFSAKTPSTPPDYGVGVLDAVELLAKEMDLGVEALLADTDYIAHGTTSSLNALVMGKVPDVGFITTKGHRDSIYIMNVEGRYLGRPQHELQDIIQQDKPRTIVPRKLAREVTERIDRDGTVIVKLDEGEARQVIREILSEGVRAIAVSLLWSFRNPEHERRLRDLIHEQDPEVFVALSSEVSPRIREFARNSTTIMSTQIGPGLELYLSQLEGKLRDRGLRGSLLVMQSSGGSIAASEAAASAITTIGGVLTGGVVGCVRMAEQLGDRNIIATDVGGTTFLAGLIVDGEPVRASDTIVNQHPVNVPTLRVEAIGSGGGAIAWIDSGGNLHVGPTSAQAAPGPACYGAGGAEPTNTDANLVLGILPETGLLGGLRPIRKNLAIEAIRTRIAEPLGLSVEEAAAAIYAVQNAQTGDLLRKIVVETGHDPRDFTVYAFGGAGPAHCAAYAAEVGVAEVVVPLGPVASAFSAFGLAVSDIVLVREHSDPMTVPFDPQRSQQNFERLEADVLEAMQRQGVPLDHVEIHREIDMRYGLQLSEVTSPVARGALTGPLLEESVADFERRYAKLYGEGSGFREAGIYGITFRVRGVGVLNVEPKFETLDDAPSHDPASAILTRRPVCLGRDGYVDTPVYDYRLLRSGHAIQGPAIVQVPTTSVVVPDGMRGLIDGFGNLRIQTRANIINLSAQRSVA
ncbi:hydantoinase/oxoprolinase family protein [Sphingobium chlorophenolicum]|uniref:5-oxoprolinase (ATP-hydrolyzing) n=1 Tax=Sphingobium chlorophenolicum TaxID=46429 RepID=A0A081RFE5_SPHCR|nr:hydantoinase/oxoprolinase family protein [Sphingobium chlorophenolicum]KEQ53918.1 5-oxoprolinase (ATP-hydrolyzing) [Sphingobium chlorophenolicum]